MSKKVSFYRLTNILIFSILLSGCASLRLASDWSSQPISIDGKYKDWTGAESYYNERAKVLINLANDENYLYISIITRNRQIEAKMLDSGFTAWFDPDGKNKKAFGICFPTGLKNLGLSLKEERDMTQDWRDQKDTSGLVDREKERSRDKDFNKKLELLEKLQDKIEIVQGDFSLKQKMKPPKPAPGGGIKEPPNKPGKEFTLQEAAKSGIEAKVGRENDYFVYELKVPLIKSAEHPYAIEAKPGKPFGLGLENSRLDLGGKGFGRGDIEDERGSLENHPSLFSEECFPLWATVILSSKAE